MWEWWMAWLRFEWRQVAVLMAILIVAAVFRFVYLDTLPPGMTHDEAAFGAEAQIILSGERPVYFALGYGHEPLYAYAAALAFRLFGHRLVVLRATMAVFGLLLVWLTWVWVRRWFGFAAAWICAAWLAVAFWPLSLARQALRGDSLAPIWLLAAWWFWEGLRAAGWAQLVESEPLRLGRWDRQRMIGYFALAGAALGLSFYTYLSARATWAVFPALAVYMLLFPSTRVLLRRIWPGLLLMMAVAGVVVTPMIWHLVQNPADQVRFTGMLGPMVEFLQGRPARLLTHLWNGVRVFTWVGDQFWAYNIPGRPIFNGIGSLLFYGGLLLSLWRWRDLRYAFLLLWFGAAMAPGLVTTNEGIFLRILAAQSVVYLFVALALIELGKWGRQAMSRLGWERWAVPLGVTVVLLLVGMEGWRTVSAYFVDWPNRPETRTIYNHTLVEVSRAAREWQAGQAVAFSSLYPLYYHDPWIFRYVSGRSDLADRWFDGRGCWLYPATDAARLVWTALTPPDASLRSEWEGSAVRLGRYDLRPDDENPYFEVWQWRGGAAPPDDIQKSMWVSSEAQFNRPDLRQALDDGATFADVMTLVGYRLSGDSFKPGDTVELVTFWRALRTVAGEDDWDTFVHLLGEDGAMIGGVDVWDCPPTGWRPGDLAVQVHRFQVGAAAAQSAWIEVGVYRHSANRLMVRRDGELLGDRVLLDPVALQER